ncbi:Uncharacterized protein APZ42_021918 [Daphnia magna]|uniref:Uncharacterized protein n=1 Tax=Daphnia magna TaxID=35525 RepID=A0A164W8D1_9CRUS|nr:Uncharacterized protein APZ42_021918 [Daphnia magna]
MGSMTIVIFQSHYRDVCIFSFLFFVEGFGRIIKVGDAKNQNKLVELGIDPSSLKANFSFAHLDKVSVSICCLSLSFNVCVYSLSLTKTLSFARRAFLFQRGWDIRGLLGASGGLRCHLFFRTLKETPPPPPKTRNKFAFSKCNPSRFCMTISAMNVSAAYFSDMQITRIVYAEFDRKTASHLVSTRRLKFKEKKFGFPMNWGGINGRTDISWTLIARHCTQF